MVITGRVSSMVENHTLCECVSAVIKNKNGTVISKCGEPLSVTRLGGRGVMRKRLTNQAHPQPAEAVVERKGNMYRHGKKIERKRTPAVAVQRIVRPRRMVKIILLPPEVLVKIALDQIVSCAKQADVKQLESLKDAANQCLDFLKSYNTDWELNRSK